MREVVSGASLAFILKIIGSGLAFGFNVAVARLLGAEGAGLYFLALSVTVIGSVIGRVGLDNALLRFTATHAIKGEWDKVLGVYSLGMRIAVGTAGTLSLIGFALAPWIALAIFDKPDLAEPLRWMSLSILPFSLLNLQAESLKGLKRISNAMLIQSSGVPLIGLVLIWPLARIEGVNGVTWGYLAATIVVALLGLWSWRMSVSIHQHAKAIFSFKNLWTSCRPLFYTSLMNRAVLPWAPLFLLGIWSSTEEVGIFGAASRVSMLVSFMLVTVNNVLAPKFAELYSRGEMAALGRTARQSALMITLLASPVFFLLVFGGKWVMSLFGAGFVDGAPVLAILAIGQLINAFTGSVGFVLMMSGHESETWMALVVSTLSSLLLCVILIPSVGIYGCAIAVMVAEIIKNLLLTRFCIIKLGITPVPLLKLRNNI